MNTWLLKSACAAVMMLGFAGTAHAGKKICDGSNGPRGDYRGFWSWFTIGASGDDCLNIFDNTNRHFEAKWSLSGNGKDAVGGMGWRYGDVNATINYNAGYWKASGKASFQLYGWSCTGTKTQEYYIVDNWGDQKYVPWDPSANNGNGALAVKKLTTANKIDGDYYDIYITTQKSDAGNGCDGSKYAFAQYWSVRQNRRFNGTASGNKSINFAAHANVWAYANRGFQKSGVSNGYQIMGAEGLNTSNGTVNMTVWK